MFVAYEWTPLLLPFAFAIVVVFLPWYLVDSFADERFRIALILFTVPFAVWALAELLRISATTLAAERLWHNLRFAGPAFSTVGYFVFAAVYTNHDTWARRRRLAALLVIPVVTMGLVWTNPQHMLVRATVEATSTGPFVLSYTPGPWFFVHGLYSYTLVAVATGWIVTRFLQFRSDSYFPKQTLSVLLSVSLIMSANLAFNLDLTTVEWTPVGGALWAVIFSIAVSEYRMFDVSPLARDVVVENMESGIVVTNAEGEIVDVNEVGATMLGTSRADLIGERLADVFLTSQQTIEEILATEGRSTTVEGQQHERRQYELTVSPISIPAADTIGRVITFADVTARVERQQQLAAQKQSLQRQNERLDEFASVVSHDLRNPLSTIDGWLSVADDAVSSDDPDLDEAEMALENIEQAHERMETIVDGLLMLARAGQTVEETEPVALAAVATDAWDHAAVDDCTLDSTIPADATIDADRDRLLQVFENLYRNAADHNELSVTLKTGLLGDAGMNTDGGKREGFYIEDTGTGVPSAQRDEIFEHGYTTNDDDGTGTGLSIVKDVVTAHGWEIDVTTGTDGGARFEITGVDIESE